MFKLTLDRWDCEWSLMTKPKTHQVLITGNLQLLSKSKRQNYCFSIHPYFCAFWLFGYCGFSICALTVIFQQSYFKKLIFLDKSYYVLRSIQLQYRFLQYSTAHGISDTVVKEITYNPLEQCPRFIKYRLALHRICFSSTLKIMF